MSEVASQTLELVGHELAHTLGEARAAIESYLEQPDNVTLLERCKHELHQAQGVLRVKSPWLYRPLKNSALLGFVTRARL